MWLALGIPPVVMVAAVLMDLFEQRCVPGRAAEVPDAEVAVDLHGQGR